MIKNSYIIFLFLSFIYAENIGCLDPNNIFYSPDADNGYFSGLVEGGESCNQNGWNGNYVGINLDYYLQNESLFSVGSQIIFDEYIYYIDGTDIPNNCNEGVALIYIVTDCNETSNGICDGNIFTYQQDYNFPFIEAGTQWSMNACECLFAIDCNNICEGSDFECLECSDGNLNNDEDVNILDIVFLVNCILNDNCLICADITLDNYINVLDIIKLIDIILNWTIGCTDPNACNYSPNNNESCIDCCYYDSTFYDCSGACLIDNNQDGICDDIPYDEYLIGFDLTNEIRDLFIINAIRFEEICLDNLGHLKNPLWSIFQTGVWSIYYHVEDWQGTVNQQAINNLTNQYQSIATDWLIDLNTYDSDAPNEVEIRVFGFVFNEGVDLDTSFIQEYGEYPIVKNYSLTNEQAPWTIQYRETEQVFDYNWYEVIDFLDLQVIDNRTDLNDIVEFYPNNWNNYFHPESIDNFYTKFWHKTTWDAVAQRQYLKIGGQITNYQTGSANYTVFAHEMGHCFFLDDIYDIGKYPDGQNLISIMNNSGYISDFDKFLLRIVWKLQKEN